jgi:CBS domain-containing protein
MKGDSTTIFREIGKKTVSDLIESANIINSNSSISKVLSKLIKMNTYNVYYKKGNKITAINLRDILSARDVTAHNLNSIAKMTPTIAEDSNIEEAVNIMSHYRLRSIPVIEDEEIIGQISTKSIIKCMNDTNIKIPSTKIMTENPLSINETDHLSTAKNIMIRHRIDHIPIVEETLKGIVTSFDIAKIILASDNLDNISHGWSESSKLLEFSAKGFAERNVTTSSIKDSVAKVIQLMNSTNSTYSIVTLRDEIKGIITYRDIISLLGQRIEEDVPAYIIGVPDKLFSSELTKSKFNTLVKFLKKRIPDLEEARCRIKLISVRGKIKRFEVDVSIFTTSNRYTYRNCGLDLVTIFDQLKDSLKMKLLQESKTSKAINKT